MIGTITHETSTTLSKNIFGIEIVNTKGCNVAWVQGYMRKQNARIQKFPSTCKWNLINYISVDHTSHLMNSSSFLIIE